MFPTQGIYLFALTGSYDHPITEVRITVMVAEAIKVKASCTAH